MSSQHFLTFFFFLLISSNTVTSSSSQKDDTFEFVRPMDKKLLGLKKEKLSHFKFYWHDTVSGKNPSSVTIVPPSLKLNSTTGFGIVNMIDNPLTLGPELSSKLVGKAQGFYASACKDELDLLMVREMPVIGGSGLFRFARGYAQANTHWFDLKSGDAVVEYNVYVFHY
ncbi:hypothetical protein P8452_30081 [Trifolium repens]|nr:hypothetical protein P8452_30081 [Trifolium repens]